MKRFDIINWLIKNNKYRSYLEIGIDNANSCFNKVKCEHKVGVDPNVGRTWKDEKDGVRHYRMTSDTFFMEENDRVFDIVFVDGLHTAEQAQKDIENGLAVLSDGGTIVVHDCRPYNRHVAAEERPSKGSWYGTVWRAWAHLRATRADLEMHVLPYDCGVGLIKRGQQDLYCGEYDTYEKWRDRQVEICNLISVEGAKRIYGKLD